MGEEDDRPWEHPDEGVRRDCEPHRGGLLLTLGILSIVLPVFGPILGLAAWIMAMIDLKKMGRREMDPEGHGLTIAGLVCGIVGLCLEGLMTLSCLAGLFSAFLAVRSAPPPPRPVPVFTAPAPPAPIPPPP